MHFLVKFMKISDNVAIFTVCKRYSYYTGGVAEEKHSSEYSTKTMPARWQWDSVTNV